MSLRNSRENIYKLNTILSIKEATIPLTDSGGNLMTNSGITYANEISDLADGFFPKYDNKKLYFGTGFAVAVIVRLLGSKIESGIGHNLYRLSGGLGFLVNRIIDLSTSVQVAREMEDPRFREYGFDNIYFEHNSFVNRNPSVKDFINLRNVTLNLIALISCLYWPNFGYGLTAITPQTFLNNRNIRKQIRLSKNISDKLKEMLQEGKSDEDVRLFLSELTKDKKRTLELYLV